MFYFWVKAIQNVFWHGATCSVSCELGRSFVTPPETHCSSVHVFKLRGKRVMYKAPFCAFPRGRSKVEIRGVCCRYYHNSWRLLSHCIGKIGCSLYSKEPMCAGQCSSCWGRGGVSSSVEGVCVSYAECTVGLAWKSTVHYGFGPALLLVQGKGKSSCEHKAIC